MGSIFWGMIFVLFDFSIEANGIKLGFLPDFVGYLFLLNGLNGKNGLGAENKCFLILYCIIQGIKNMEKQYGIQLNGDNLINVWKLDLLCQRFLSGQAAV